MTGGFQAILVEKITMSRHIKWHELAGARTWFLLALVLDRKSTRLNSSHSQISYAVFCLKKKNRHSHGRRHHPRAARGSCRSPAAPSVVSASRHPPLLECPLARLPHALRGASVPRCHALRVIACA